MKLLLVGLSLLASSAAIAGGGKSGYPTCGKNFSSKTCTVMAGQVVGSVPQQMPLELFQVGSTITLLKCDHVTQQARINSGKQLYTSADGANLVRIPVEGKSVLYVDLGSANARVYTRDEALEYPQPEVPVAELLIQCGPEQALL